MTAAAAPDLLSRFSESVRTVAGDLQATPVSAAEIAYALLRAHPEYIDGELTVEPRGQARPVMDWLWHCWSLYDPDKIGGVVDGRLTILALARIDDRLNAALRRGGRRRLELQRTFAEMAWGWAQPVRVREFATTAESVGGFRCALNRDGTRFAVSTPYEVRVRNVTSVDYTVLRPARWLAFASTDDTLALATSSGVFVFDGTSRTLTDEAATHCAFSGDDRLLACAHGDRVTLRTLAGDEVLRIPVENPLSSAFSPDGTALAIASLNRVGVWDVASGEQSVDLHVSGVHGCEFTPDGRRLLTVGDRAKLWEVATRRGRWLPHIAGGWALSPDGQLVLDANGALDLASGIHRHAPTGESFAFSGDGRFAGACSEFGTNVLEILAGARKLPEVAADTVDGDDLLGLEADANALADVIAASSTKPPLSIGLFGDWRSGKSFLIRQIQQRVDERSARAEHASQAAHCGYVRNIVFNAWHYADANLWASLATHILDELAKPAGASKATRLLEEIAKSSGEREELARASATVERAAARRKLKLWTWGLVAPGQQETLSEVRRGLKGITGAFELLLPTWRARAAVILPPLLAAGAVLGLVGVDTAAQLAGAAATAATATAGWVGVGATRVKKLLDRAGAGTKVEDVRASDAKAELRAAQVRESHLQQELADLSSGRRLARYAAERAKSGDYRSQLGVVSRIREDFERMTDILERQTKLAAKDAAAGDLPRIDRIVLYIDDLDRCPPQRVVEVLEAVHLILALRLFVVVLAVDPRWLKQSLELHYSALLNVQNGASGSTPANYLEKIIQVPFTLRPMSTRGVAALVGGLLPVAEPEQEPERAQTASDEPAAEAITTPAAPEPAPAPRGSAATQAPLANVNPRTLALTIEERDFAAAAAGRLPTPRAVKKLTNLYRLLRARLDEDSGELDAFLDRSGPEIPECEAVLILLAVLIAFPDTASEFLLSFGDLDPAAASNEVNWLDHVNAQEPQTAAFLGAMTEHATFGGTSTCEPFRRWALEVSRYSFETGQKVFAGRR